MQEVCFFDNVVKSTYLIVHILTVAELQYTEVYYLDQIFLESIRFNFLEIGGQLAEVK